MLMICELLIELHLDGYTQAYPCVTLARIYDLLDYQQIIWRPHRGHQAETAVVLERLPRCIVGAVYCLFFLHVLRYFGANRHLWWPPRRSYWPIHGNSYVSSLTLK